MTRENDNKTIAGLTDAIYCRTKGQQNIYMAALMLLSNSLNCLVHLAKGPRKFGRPIARTLWRYEWRALIRIPRAPSLRSFIGQPYDRSIPNFRPPALLNKVSSQHLTRRQQQRQQQQQRGHSTESKEVVVGVVIKTRRPTSR